MRIKRVLVHDIDENNVPFLHEVYAFADDRGYDFYYSFNENVDKWACIDKNSGMVVMWGDDFLSLLENTERKITQYYEIQQSEVYRESVDIYHMLLLERAKEKDKHRRLERINKENSTGNFSDNKIFNNQKIKDETERKVPEKDMAEEDILNDEGIKEIAHGLVELFDVLSALVSNLKDTEKENSEE